MRVQPIDRCITINYTLVCSLKVFTQVFCELGGAAQITKLQTKSVCRSFPSLLNYSQAENVFANCTSVVQMVFSIIDYGSSQDTAAENIMLSQESVAKITKRFFKVSPNKLIFS